MPKSLLLSEDVSRLLKGLCRLCSDPKVDCYYLKKTSRLIIFTKLDGYFVRSCLNYTHADFIMGVNAKDVYDKNIFFHRGLFPSSSSHVQFSSSSSQVDDSIVERNQSLKKFIQVYLLLLCVITAKLGGVDIE